MPIFFFVQTQLMIYQINLGILTHLLPTYVMVGFIRGAMLSCFKDYSGAAIEKISNFVSDKYVKT